MFKKMINLLNIYEKNKQLIDKIKIYIFDINRSITVILDENQKFDGTN